MDGVTENYEGDVGGVRKSYLLTEEHFLFWMSEMYDCILIVINHHFLPCAGLRHLLDFAVSLDSPL